MSSLEKLKSKNGKKKVVKKDEGKLYREMMAGTPEYKSSEEALIACEKRLEQLAKKFGLTASELFHQAETSREFKEEYLEVFSLSSQVNYFRKK